MQADFVIHRRKSVAAKDDSLSSILRIKKAMSNPLAASKLVTQLRRSMDHEFDTELNVVKLYLDQKNVVKASMVLEGIRSILYKRFSSAEILKLRIKNLTADIGSLDIIPRDVLIAHMR